MSLGINWIKSWGVKEKDVTKDLKENFGLRQLMQ
jgi:hypothetical protein